MEKTPPVSTEFVKASIRGRVGVLTLDRPKALNALDQPMCLAIDHALAAWARDDAVSAVIIRGARDRAFCAGGDVRAIHDDGIAWKQGASDGRLGREFFRDEYRMNRRIKTFSKPFVAMIDGITMGGGVGLSIHGSYRVATENTVLAMPETGIGLFPDVGTSFALPRLPGELGTYLGLTGARIKSGDLIDFGIATHVIASADIDACVADLSTMDTPTDVRPSIDRILQCRAIAAAPTELVPYRRLIDRCFAADRVETILAALDISDDAFARSTATTLRRMSPTSLKLTLTALRRGRSLDFDECLKMEYRMSQSLLAEHDFYEGVRAQLVDKDRSPKWYPATLDAVDDAAIDSHFLTPLHGDLSFPD